MPLLGEGHSDLVRDEAPYFTSLAELDTWFTQSYDRLSGVVPYQPRLYADGQSNSRGKLLVCHDYKGGYKEFPSGLCYTFNFWGLCDTFVYFSHNRVTIPPAGWTNAAHKQGTGILGTLIFEGRDNPDCLQLLIGSADFVVTDNKIPISKHYAALLAELAYQRGFDGYLLNFESRLKYKINHAHALAAWILLLKSELRSKVGPHAQVVWYDSVIYNGRISYQNRLNSYNLPFFLASDSLFTNYWWNPETQASMTRYFMDLKRVAGGPTDTSLSIAAKSLQDIYSGVDVFPRDDGIYQYGCGLTCYRAITHTSPRGFSTAIFAPGWTWEGETENAEENWDKWWDNERRMWLGPTKPGETIPVPDCPEGPFKPVTTFFQDLPPPDPSRTTFCTHFSPGIGYNWFVEGRKVLDTTKGWTDIDKQGAIGNLVWPWPTPSWQGDTQYEVPPTASTALDMTDGYNGGNTLKLTLAYVGNKLQSSVRTIWLPVQSLTVTTRKSLQACVVYKATSSSGADLEINIHAKPLSEEEKDSRVFAVGEVISSNVPRGWTSQTINFTSTTTSTTYPVAIGFLIETRSRDPLADITLSISLGYLVVYPSPPPPFVSVGIPSVTRAKFTLAPPATNPSVLEGALTWDTASTFSPIDVDIEDTESTTPAWLLEDAPAYRFPSFVYFNVYVTPLDVGSAHIDPSADAVFIGTTGLDGRANRFYVEPACLPSDCDTWAGVRFYVQGVTDRGEVLPWERCATADHMKNKA